MIAKKKKTEIRIPVIMSNVCSIHPSHKFYSLLPDESLLRGCYKIFDIIFPQRNYITVREESPTGGRIGMFRKHRLKIFVFMFGLFVLSLNSVPVSVQAQPNDFPIGMSIEYNVFLDGTGIDYEFIPNGN